MRIRLVQRHVVFVDQQDDLLAVVLFEKDGQFLQASSDICFFVLSLQHLFKILLLVSGQFIAVGQKSEA